ncbi:MAG: FAD-dependent oxidoreductase [Firmicutes bacterium]|nr:FAD-dependent oxidoreductase [Alicyclobacillaceae bacterium]MCL6497377.1 FAD-dependent oxidoreductase [Bacillota bacterium]
MEATRAIEEPSRKTPVLGEYEVVVLGGGPAGIMAAAAAGRAGRSTILIERYGFLGGAGTVSGLSSFCGLHARVFGEHRQVVHGLADELLERIDRLDGLNPPHISFGNRIMAQAYDTAAYKIAADEMLLSSGVKLLFHAFAVGAVMADPQTIAGVLIESKSGRGAILGKMFIDCSGDGDLAAWAGAPYEKGDPRTAMLYPTTMFRINQVDPERAGKAGETLARLMEEAEQAGRAKFPRKGVILFPQKHPIEWRANLTQIRKPDGSAVDGTDLEDLAWGEVEGRRQVKDLFAFIKANAPGFEDSYIVDIAPQIGIRETRRVVGEYQLTEDDVLDCADFPDTIGVNGWPIEAHVAGAVQVRWPRDPEGRGFHQLPYRMILPQRIENLLVAGRCASMTHVGQSSARVTGPAFAMGQAAGIAADMALQAGVAPRAIDVGRLQERLEAIGAYLGRRV